MTTTARHDNNLEKNMTDKSRFATRVSGIKEGASRVTEAGVTFDEAATAMQGLMAQWHLGDQANSKTNDKE